MAANALHIDAERNDRIEQIYAMMQRPRALLGALASRGDRVFKAHFLRRNQEGNKYGWPRSNFWVNKVRKQTAITSVTDEEAEITVASPEFVHKIRGGKVAAKRGRYLAIPLTAAAKKAGSPREWDDPSALFPVRSAETGAFFLAMKTAGGILPVYDLKRSVTHKADPRALPSEAEISRELTDEAVRTIDRELRRAATS